MREWVAEREVLCIRSGGPRRLVGIRVGRPWHVRPGEWRCAIALEGLYERLDDACGEDSLQALVAALVELRELLENFVRDGGRLVSPFDGSELAVHRLFAGIG